MASHPRIEGRADRIYGAMVKWMSRKMLGEVPKPVAVLWHIGRC